MKQFIFSILLISIAILTLQQCRRDPLLHAPNKETDSVYIGTKYILKIPFSFPSIKSEYKDSLTYEGILLGRRLFYDKHLSFDGQKSCASCHHLQYAFSDSVATSLNEFGPTKRNAPALQNLAWANSFFWDGRQPTLVTQAQDAFQHELAVSMPNTIAYLNTDTTYTKLFKKAFGRPGNISEGKIYLAIQQFLMTAVSANSRFDSVMRGQGEFTPSEYNGFYNLFLTERGDCFHCHAFGGNLLMTDNSFHNNGLDSAASIYDFADAGRAEFTAKPADYGVFKSPTLRNIAVSGPYMHDGRYTTLQQVINFYSDSLHLSPTVDVFILKHIDTTAGGVHLHKGGVHLSAQDKQDLLNLMYTFTDTTFLNNPNLRNPF